jgi:surfeit locus 1 family protein
MVIRRLFWIAFVAIGAATMIALGFWQLGRLEERRALNARIESRLSLPLLTLTGEALDVNGVEYRRVTVAGVFDFSQEIVLRNRALSNIAGVHLLTPLKIEGSEAAVIVDRGWIPYEAAAPEVRAAYASPTGLITLTGLARLSQSRPSFLAPADPPLSPGLPRVDQWYWVNIPQIQQQIPYPLLPFFVEQAAGPDPTALPAAGYEIELSDGPHLSYAIQWFSFAAILVIGAIALARKNMKRQTSNVKVRSVV